MEYRIDTANEEATGEFQYLYEHFNEMADEIVVSRQREVKLYEMQLDNLKLQINPHMLLNSFNMIYGLAQSKNYECIQEYALLLAEYFRYALKETDRFVPLKKEMDFVENYIAIQKLRFPNTFTSAYHVSEECENVLIPPLLIENFVENSMKYASIPGKVIEVLINIRKENDRLLISIIDTGRGMKPEVYAALQTGEVYVDKNNKRHIGVWNCRRRLEVFYHGEAKMNIISMPNQGTQIWLDLPFTTEQEDRP